MQICPHLCRPPNITAYLLAYLHSSPHLRRCPHLSAFPQALLEADSSMQVALNDMGATAVMLQALQEVDNDSGGGPSLIFRARLGLEPSPLLYP